MQIDRSTPAGQGAPEGRFVHLFAPHHATTLSQEHEQNPALSERQHELIRIAERLRAIGAHGENPERLEWDR